MPYYSHPNKLLIDHLREVYNYAKGFTKELKKEDRLCLQIACLSHDFGKFTTYFQHYLLEGKKSGETYKHGLLSALFAAHVALESYEKGDLYPLFIYNVVLHHHLNLKSLDRSLPTTFFQEEEDYPETVNFENLGKQIKDLVFHKEEVGANLAELQLASYLNSFLSIERSKEILKELKRRHRTFIKGQKRTSTESKARYFFLHQLIFSGLISADKISAAGVSLPNKLPLAVDRIRVAREQRIGSSQRALDKVREEIFSNIMDRILTCYKDERIFSITAPTGTGKTYSGFFAALKIRELTGNRRQIIYGLPFTSIIDQSHQVINDLLTTMSDYQENSSRYLMKHHHLSDVEYHCEETEFSTDHALLLMENWEAEIVVTTFIQLFETLAGYRNRMLKKFHNLQGSIIILDELQTLPIKYWSFIEELLKQLAVEFDTYIIMMTATRPMILPQAQELLRDYQRYFSMLNRVTLQIDLNSKEVGEFVERFLVNHTQERSYLIICNTINSSLEIYHGLREALDATAPVYYLSTNLIPLHRKERIQEIKNLLGDKSIVNKPILVATQVVEAGVDFDFDVVIRDIAPLDSIIQGAGRCNRNGVGKGLVQVIKLVKEKGR
ncbi:MAG: CRISPR-associated helicase Cas3' [Clostridia bacterium]|nr:CRISPR-associated helicase Cas3' [Clostridia bacterium]